MLKLRMAANRPAIEASAGRGAVYHERHLSGSSDEHVECSG
jgi:hypothetical protein